MVELLHIETQVAAQVAAFIPDRATLQLGIGSLPVAVARALSGHRDLGIHTGSVFDVLVDLVEAGVVTNAWKGIDAGVSVAGCLFGASHSRAVSSHHGLAHAVPDGQCRQTAAPGRNARGRPHAVYPATASLSWRQQTRP